MSIYHTCVASEVASYRRMVEGDSDTQLLEKSDWEQFKTPPMEQDRAWRLFCGIARREAARRGLKIP